MLDFFIIALNFKKVPSSGWLYTYFCMCMYRQISNIKRISVGNKIVDRSDVFASAAPTTSSFST